MWIRPLIKENGNEYYEMVLCYVDDVIVMSEKLATTIEGISRVFYLKGDKETELDMYLGASFQKVRTVSGGACWEISDEKYVKEAIKN